METKSRRKYHGKWYLILAASVAVAIALVPMVSSGCDSGAVKTVVTGESSGQETWTGNGGDNNDECAYGGSLYWVLTPGGSGELISGTLHVTFVGGATGSFTGFFEGGGGAMKFVSSGDTPVQSAYADYTYNGTLTNVVLTISHVVSCNTTTTEVDEESTTTSTTTVREVTSTTSTTVGEESSTTSTAVGEVTSTTAKETTTTGAEETTSTAVAGATSTTVQNLTTAGRIDTGGGGTAGGGPNVMLWLIVSLLGALAVALGGSAIWSGLKQKSDR